MEYTHSSNSRFHEEGEPVDWVGSLEWMVGRWVGGRKWIFYYKRWGHRRIHEKEQTLRRPFVHFYNEHTTTRGGWLEDNMVEVDANMGRNFTNAWESGNGRDESGNIVSSLFSIYADGIGYEQQGLADRTLS